MKTIPPITPPAIAPFLARCPSTAILLLLLAVEVDEANVALPGKVVETDGVGAVGVAMVTEASGEEEFWAVIG